MPAYPESDIIWADLYKDKIISIVKTLILWVLLLLISVVLLTPIILLNMSNEIITMFNLDKSWLSKNVYNNYLSSLMTMLMNVILIPFFIDIMVMIEDYHTKSQRQVAILNRNFIFMVLNSLLLPLTSLTTIKSLASALN